MTDVKAPKLWREKERFVHAVVERAPSGGAELVTLDCGHRLRMPIAGATHIRCRYCIREEISGYNPPDDPTPAKTKVAP